MGSATREAARLSGHSLDGEFEPVYRVVGLVALLLPVLVLGHLGNASYLPLPARRIENAYLVLGLLACAAAIWLGVRRGWRETVSLASGAFVVFLYSEYLDWWWDSMPKYLFFLIVGLTAVGALALLKRLRRAMAARPREEAA